MNLFAHPPTVAGCLHFLIVATVMLRVIMKRPATGVALAWLLIVAVLPGFGVTLYLLIGERRIGERRIRRISQLRTSYRRIRKVAVHAGLSDVDWSRHPPEAEAMNRLGQTFAGFGTVRGSEFQLYSKTPEILAALAADIDAAQKSVLMEFYIWNEGGAADQVLEAVIRAAQRGVVCRVLIDALGARPWWKGEQPQRLRDAGVSILPALPVGLVTSFIGRTDLRVHRKIVVVDGEIAWTGSMNLVDPAFFKQDSGVGEWVDAMVRLRGAAVAPLAATMIGDWMLETGEPLEEIASSAQLKLVSPRGDADIQVIPSGPGESADGILQMILALINAAREDLILTTPYLVPDESMLRAIRGAAARGVRVKLILPEKVDSFMTRYACRSYYDDLLSVGVEIHLFRGGLLHTKSITADKRMSMFGTVNLDMRSLWLNYEVALFVYDAGFCEALYEVQSSYLQDSERLNVDQWNARPFHERFLENTLRLASPLL